MLTGMTEGDWAAVLKLFRACRSRRGDKGRNDRKFLEALHYFTVHNITWRALAEIRQLEQHLETVLAAEPSGRLRGLVRGARREQPDRPSGADVRLHHRPGACLGRRGKRGQGRGTRPLARGLLDQDPPQGRSGWRPLAFHLTEGQAERQPAIRDPARPRAGHHAPRGGGRQRVRRQGATGWRRGSGASARSSRSSHRPRSGRPSSRRRSTGPRPHRAARGQAQALQAHCAPLRENAKNYGSFVAFALGLIIVKSVHTA